MTGYPGTSDLLARAPVGEDDLLTFPEREADAGSVHSRGHQREDASQVVMVKTVPKWEEMETSLLLQCMNGDNRFKKGATGVINWDCIVEEINKNGGPLRTKEQCQNRYDILLKAYRKLNVFCLEKGKEFCEVTEDEKQSLNLATSLGEEHEEWYNHIHAIVEGRLLRDNCRKRQKRNGDVIESSKFTKASSKVVVRKFNRMNEELRYTFLNLVQVYSLGIVWISYCSLEILCRFLAIVQDQDPLDIRNHVYELQRLKLVTLTIMGLDEDIFRDCWMDKEVLGHLHLEVSKEFGSKLMGNNLHLNIFQCLWQMDTIGTNPLMQQIKVLNLYGCEKIKEIDLTHFPHLCCLIISNCEALKTINGWEVARRLGWIAIKGCHFYCNFPDIQFLISLKEFYFEGCRGQDIPWQLANFSPCVQLRRLEICGNHKLVKSMNVKALRFLEVLSFAWCETLTTIHGLSGLQALRKLDVRRCNSLKVILELGCLKVLTCLNISNSGIIEIHGLEELHLLTRLIARGCKSLQSLPPLGHLKALAYLDLYDSCIEEIRGVEDLVSLETLLCSYSKLKRLPNLEHLRRLRHIDVANTHLSEMDRSRRFIGGHERVVLDDLSDISDMKDCKDISSNEF